jgi:hypothetical protein
MRDFASKDYLHPESHAHKLAQAIKRLGRRAATHPRSTFVHDTEPRVLTAFQRKRELERLARARRAA